MKYHIIFTEIQYNELKWLACLDSFPTSTISLLVKEPINNSETDYHRKQHWTAMQSKMQSLTSCQCSVCCGCFQQHFTIAVRDKHIRDMVCPVCWEPDINDPEHLNSYFSTLDNQVVHHTENNLTQNLPQILSLKREETASEAQFSGFQRLLSLQNAGVSVFSGCVVLSIMIVTPVIIFPTHTHTHTPRAQLRECLEPEVYDLFHKKLTEQALIKDPKFLWCSHCSYGFIYDGDQLKVTCFQCRNSFCAQCKKPWESQHGGLSCEHFMVSLSRGNTYDVCLLVVCPVLFQILPCGTGTHHSSTHNPACSPCPLPTNL
uniref:RING-type domain-containing protein n=1 Tax=Hucho hucho TaxID=62062 RepID=A0A4W5JMS5_9TELE